MGEALNGRESSPVRWEGPPTDNKERSGKVKDTGGSFFGEGHRVVTVFKMVKSGKSGRSGQSGQKWSQWLK